MRGHPVRAAALAAAASLALTSSTFAAVVAANAVSAVNPQLESSWSKLGDTWTQTTRSIDVVGPNGEVYKNNTNFQGSGLTQAPGGPVTGQAGTAVQTLHVLADDLTLDPAATVGDKIVRFTFSVANFNAAARTVRPHVTFYLNDGANGGPGTIAAAFLFNPLSVGASTISNFGFNVPVASQFAIPTNRFLWAGETFDNGGGATATNSELDSFGQGLYNPPTIGNSQNLFFSSTNPDDGFVNAPSGTIGGLGGATPPVASFGWELRVAVPEPVGISLLLIGGVRLLGRRGRAHHRGQI